MPLDKGMSFSGMVSELMEKFKKSGTIGKTSPKSTSHARSIASAIAHRTKREG